MAPEGRLQGAGAGAYGQYPRNAPPGMPPHMEGHMGMMAGPLSPDGAHTAAVMATPWGMMHAVPPGMAPMWVRPMAAVPYLTPYGQVRRCRRSRVLLHLYLCV
jgi:hypothetical protein